MGLVQFARTIGRIAAKKHVNRPAAVGRHLQWQLRRLRGGFPFEQTISRSRIVAHSPRCGVSVSINACGMYDYDHMHLLQEVLEDGGVFFDIGANIGSYTLVASEPPSARVFAFEPHPRTFALLEENVRLNARSNVVCVHAALGRRSGDALLTDQPTSATNHLLPGSAAGGVPVSVITAQEYCTARGITPSVVKVDVEGFEYDVLCGFGPLLWSVDLVLVEMNGLADARSTGQAEVHDLLIAHGLAGPYCCDFDRHTLRRDVVGDATNFVYCSDRFRRSAAQWTFGD